MMLHMTPEQHAAHQERVKSARVVRGRCHDKEAIQALPEAEAPKPQPKAKQPRKSAVVKEAEVLRACMDVLEVHPIVNLWWRQNSGAQRIGNRFIKFGFRGASDLMGVLSNGRFLAVEVKAPGNKPTTEQAGFLGNVTAAGGLAMWVTSADRLADTLDHYKGLVGG